MQDPHPLATAEQGRQPEHRGMEHRESRQRKQHEADRRDPVIAPVVGRIADDQILAFKRRVRQDHVVFDAAGHSGDHDKGKSENCCGLFCVTVGAIPFATSLADSIYATEMNFVMDYFLGGRPTDRIDRPPRPLLSL